MIAGPIEIWDWVINLTDNIVSLQKVLNFHTFEKALQQVRKTSPKNQNETEMLVI